MTGLDAVRVLVVDDNKHMRSIVTTVLRALGVRHLRECSDGAEALDAMKSWPADLAVVDFQMYPMDGVEFTRHVRTDPDTPNPYLPIIMMTGHADAGRVMEARDAGVTEFLAKPLTARVMAARINTVIFHPRPFVRTGDYFGPDRRRRPDPEYRGPMRRATDAELRAVPIDPKARRAASPQDGVL